MRANASAYAVLGLPPNAGRAAVDAAYKMLIKRYHPDRQGGNSLRAAEINQAYRLIRNAKYAPATDPSGDDRAPVDGQPILLRQRHARRKWRALLIVALVAIVALESDRVAGLFDSPFEPLAEPWTPLRAVVTGEPAEPLEQPLDGDGIERSVLAAARLLDGGDPQRLAEQSRRCHAQLRRSPDASRLDRCVAFDETVVAVTRGTSLNDAGPFSASAVSARQIAAARMLSDDFFAIESRLGRIRTRVELTLAPGTQPPPLPLPADDPAAGQP